MSFVFALWALQEATPVSWSGVCVTLQELHDRMQQDFKELDRQISLEVTGLEKSWQQIIQPILESVDETENAASELGRRAQAEVFKLENELKDIENSTHNLNEVRLAHISDHVYAMFYPAPKPTI